MEPPQSTSSSPGLHGWLLVAVSFVALSITLSARASLGLAMPVWATEFGWSRSFLSSGGAIGLIVVAMLAPVAGSLVDRYGPRPLLSGGLLAVGLGMALVAVMDRPWLFLLGFGGVAAIGFGMVANHVVATAVSLVFERRRGLAVGIATSGSTAGQLLVIPLLALLMVEIGWRTSFGLLAATALVLAPVAWLVIRPGRGGGPREAAAGLSARLRFLAVNPVFHALFWSFTICGFTTTGVIETHLLPYTQLCGYSTPTGAEAYGLLSAFNMIGMVGAGWLTDRCHRPWLLATIYLMRGLAFVLLLFVVRDGALLVLFAVMFGLFDFSTVPVTASLVASHLGLRMMGLAMGLIAAGHAVGAAAGALLGGWLFDLFLRYDGLWLVSIGLAVAAGLLVLTIPEPRGRQPVRAAAQPA
jgi:predicted MFS family arabinose efflux permease